MEELPNFEESESVINKLIEDLATQEDVNADDIFSDIITFSELSEEDEDAGEYLKEVAEKIGITVEEMFEYAKKLREE
jgi:acetylornithine deacetylase/succinyl-diaminopimelate desuccinylase-like protein